MNLFTTTVALGFLTLFWLQVFRGDLKSLIPILLFAWVLMAFFTIVELSLYYLTQPFDENMKVVNPFYRLLRAPIYLIPFAARYLPTLQISSLLLGTLIMSLVSAVLIFMVWRMAPSTLRVR
ncbi:hypothetical protein ABB02_01477 [Clostridiaceae bacterium JG1575]|nr:hypothetical protein ABB02_01477 [Clostridiaceae bacterium JG1575]